MEVTGADDAPTEIVGYCASDTDGDRRDDGERPD